MPLSYYAGIALIPIGCASSAVGLLLMKASQDLRPDLPPWRSWRWLLGFMLLGVVATSVDVIVLGILPLSVYAPFAGLTIVISLLVSASGLITQPPETLSASDVRSIALVLIGVTLVSAFGPEPSSSHVSFEAVLAAYTSPQLAGLLAIASTGASTQLCMYPAGFPTLCPAWAAPMLTALSAALCGCVSQLMLKLVSISAGELPYSSLAFGFALALLACAAPVHLRLLNKTLAGTAVSLSVPCYQFLMIFCATSAGGILFGEFAHLSTSEAQAYTVGVLAATAGLAVLSRNSAAEAAHAAEELGELQTLSEGTQSCEGDMSSYDDEVAPPSPQVARCTSMRRNSITVGGLGGVGIGAAIEEAQAALDEPQSRRMRGRAMSWSGGPFPPTLPDTPSTSLSGTPSKAGSSFDASTDSWRRGRQTHRRASL